MPRWLMSPSFPDKMTARSGGTYKSGMRSAHVLVPGWKQDETQSGMRSRRIQLNTMCMHSIPRIVTSHCSVNKSSSSAVLASPCPPEWCSNLPTNTGSCKLSSLLVSQEDCSFKQSGVAAHHSLLIGDEIQPDQHVHAGAAFRPFFILLSVDQVRSLRLVHYHLGFRVKLQQRLKCPHMVPVAVCHCKIKRVHHLQRAVPNSAL